MDKWFGVSLVPQTGLIWGILNDKSGELILLWMFTSVRNRGYVIEVKSLKVQCLHYAAHGQWWLVCLLCESNTLKAFGLS